MDNDLKERVYERFENMTACAEALDWPRQKLSYILNRQRIPSLEDTARLAEALDWPVELVIEKILHKRSHKCD